MRSLRIKPALCHHNIFKKPLFLLLRIHCGKKAYFRQISVLVIKILRVLLPTVGISQRWPHADDTFHLYAGFQPGLSYF